MNQQSKPPGVVNWVGYLAITFLLLLPVAVLTVRAGAWQQGLLLYALSCLGCFILVLLAVVLVLLPRFAPWRSSIAWRASLALPGSLLLLIVFSSRGDYPPIHDITTDIQDPPTFTQAEQQRGASANSLEIDKDAIAQQQTAYPDLQTLRSTLSIDAAFDRALQVANNMNLEVYHQDRNAGIIEAVDTTSIMAFKDDIVIRVRSNAQGTLLDLRSVSRVGIGDIGANTKRIRSFQQQFES
jgi:uncharacterized protein (DUF1499 family)